MTSSDNALRHPLTRTRDPTGRPMTLTESLLAALLLATAGAGHCLGMCGALSVNISFAVPEQDRRQRALLRWHALVNLGRVSGYAVLGALSGGLGAVFQQQSPVVMRAMMLVSALVMLLLALQLLGRAAGLQHLEALGQRLWRHIQPLLGKLMPLRAAWQALALGALWGLLPCGLIYSALLLAAATGSAWHGALLMLTFGSVTAVPVATSGLLAGRLALLRQPVWRTLAALVSVFLALYLGWRAVQPADHSGHANAPAGMPAAAHHHHP